MFIRYSKLFKAIHFIGDLLLLNIAFLLAYQIRFSAILFDHYLVDKYTPLVIIFNIVWVLTTLLLNIYDFYRVMSLENVLKNLVKAVLLHSLLIAIFIVSSKGYFFSRKFLIFVYVYFGVLIIVFRAFFLLLTRKLRSRGFNTRTAVIVGLNEVGINIYNHINAHPEYGFNFLGFFGDEKSGEEEFDNLHLGALKGLERYVQDHKVEEMFCAIPLSNVDLIRKLKKFADDHVIRFKVAPDFRGFHNRQVNLEFYGDVPIMLIRAEPLENPFNLLLKRLFDIVFSLFVIIFVLSWLAPIFAIIIKLTSKGPVIFKQKRSGKVNTDFWCYKFRTMYVNDNADTKQATKGDKRITPIGKFLRSTSLDELPQFFNVLIGNMSVVGPRPHMLKHTEEYARIIDQFMVRHFVKPGITGMAQVRGYRGETTDPNMMQKRVKVDVWYIENWSFLLDLKIIYYTIRMLLKGDENAF